MRCVCTVIVEARGFLLVNGLLKCMLGGRVLSKRPWHAPLLPSYHCCPQCTSSHTSLPPLPRIYLSSSPLLVAGCSAVGNKKTKDVQFYAEVTGWACWSEASSFVPACKVPSGAAALLMAGQCHPRQFAVSLHPYISPGFKVCSNHGCQALF